MNHETLATRILETARRAGAEDAAVSITRHRLIELTQRDGELENVREATSSRLNLSVYLEGRTSNQSTSDLRWESLEASISNAVALTRLLSPDPHAGLADPALYEDRHEGDLGLRDPAYDDLDMDARRERVAALEAHAHPDDERIISTTASWSDHDISYVRAHSNGFLGSEATTHFSASAKISMQDPSGKRPGDGMWLGARHLQEIPTPDALGAQAYERAVARLGARKVDSGVKTLVFENRAVAPMLHQLLSAMYGPALQQKRSFLRGRLHEAIANTQLTVRDVPLIPRALGSRRFDEDGISATDRSLIEDGVLTNFLIDVYHARKLEVAPTGGSTSNIVVSPGERTLAQLISDVGDGIFVTGFLGGNGDPSTGEFSKGIEGFLIENGEITVPVAEINIAGTHADLWRRVRAVGNDPWVHSSWRTPSLVLDDVSVSGA